MPTAVAQNIKVEYEKYTLSNGLDVILHVDRSVPVVAVNLWYHVGSAREKPGKSGFAHLFEHMMFQGSKHVKDSEHFRFIEEAGGTLNGSTSTDRTNYWEVLPKNYLDLALWLESDRMGWLLPAMTQEKLDNQRDVVMNERRQNYDNRPYGLAFEILAKHLYPPGHPYSWPTIGSMEDLRNASLEDVIEFFKTFYGPNNSSLCIGGDIDIDGAKKQVEKYFGQIPAGPPVENPVQWIPELEKELHIIHQDNVQLPRVYLAWHTSHLFGKGDAEMDIVSDLLSHGKNSRLYRSLVYEKQIAQDVYAYHISMEIGSLFVIVSTAHPGVGLTELKDHIDGELHRLRTEGPLPRELERIKNYQKSSFIYSLQTVGGFYGVTDRLNEYNIFLTDPGFINHDLGRYLSVNRDSLMEYVNKCLSSDKRVILSIVPKGKTELAVQS